MEEKGRKVRRQQGVPDGRDLIGGLPDECTQIIFGFLTSARDRCACAAVCKKWLLLLAHMRGCEFNSFRLASRNLGLSHRPSTRDPEASRCLEAQEANDARLAAMAVGTYATKLLGRLSVRGGPPSPAKQCVTDFGLHIVSHSFPNLRSLALWDCFMVGSSGLAAIAECCHSLEKLDINNIPGIDDDGLVPIAKNCPNLSALSIQSCPLVGNRTLEALAECSSHLESLSIARCPQVRDAGMASMVAHLPNLTKVRLAHLKLGTATAEAIGTHRGSIRVLCLENLQGWTMAAFSWIKLARNLEVLSLNNLLSSTDGDIHFGDGGSSMLPPFRLLRQVSIKSCALLEDDTLVALARCALHLDTLKLERCDRVTAGGILTALRTCERSLKVFSLTRCGGVGGSPEGERRRRGGGGGCPSLESIAIRSCPGVDDGFLQTMGRMCAKLSRIELAGLDGVTDRGVVCLLRSTSPSCATPAKVSLRCCRGVTDWAVVNVARAFRWRLESLSVEGCEEVGDRSMAVVAELCSGLKELDVSRTGVGDRGVVSVATAAQQRLEVVSLGGCAAVTDVAVGCLEIMCGGLVGLDLQHCPAVTRQAVESLRATLWWCDLLC